MFTFRQKIFITYAVLVISFIAIMFPFAAHTVRSLFIKVMEDRATEIIDNIKDASDNRSLVLALKRQKRLIFFRMSVITNERKVLYDSHTRKLLGEPFSQEYIVNHPEVIEALKTGVGYHEDYSSLLSQPFSYIAKTFDFHGKPYVVRIAFPYKHVSEITNEFKLGFMTLGSLILLLFSFITWFGINHLTRPIQRIINVVSAYQEGEQTALPIITSNFINPHDEFGKLASTLNSLSIKIQKQIDSLTDEKNEKKAILESLVEGVIAVDGAMIVTYANQSALKFLDCRSDEFVGFPLTTHHFECYDLLTSCQEEHSVLENTWVTTTKDQKYYLELLAAPKKGNNGAILVFQDKSIHYRMLEMRKDFIANASHELKTPITIIQGFAETLESEDLPKELVKEIMGKMVRNCRRMTQLIKDLLALSDVESLPEVRLIDVDLHALIENCISLLQDGFPGAQITLKSEFEEETLIVGDPNLLEMAFNNFIENGIKYSKSPAKLDITLSVQGDQVRIIIKDNGIGIPAADLPHIFERFYTVNKAHSRKMGGSGLGLAIVDNVISKHHGKISVASIMDQGTTFTVFLPRKKD